MHPGSVAFYYIISYIFFLSFLAWYIFLVSFPPTTPLVHPTLPVVPHLRPSFTIRKVFPSREAILAFAHLAYFAMLHLSSYNDLSTN